MTGSIRHPGTRFTPSILIDDIFEHRGLMVAGRRFARL
jgi:hypothetical protein